MTKSIKIIILAPISGTLVSLADVPDVVFSQKMLGDGIAIEPKGDTLFAPCSGTITQIHRAAHALTLTTFHGVELLMHIGLETVLLKGQGFSPKVQVGDIVQAGDILITFDLDYIKENATSTLTMLVISNPDSIIAFKQASDTHFLDEETKTKNLSPVMEVQAAKTPILELTVASLQSNDVSSEGALTTEVEGQGKNNLSDSNPIADNTSLSEPNHAKTFFSDPILVINPSGFHARPTAVLTNAAKKFNASIQIEKDAKKANAKSVTSIMALDVCFQDSIRIVASGVDAEVAIEALFPLLQSGLGEDISEQAMEQITQAEQVLKSPFSQPKSAVFAEPYTSKAYDKTGDKETEQNLSNLFSGISAAPGLVSGKIFHFRRAETIVQEKGGNIQAEETALTLALAKGIQELKELQAQLQNQSEGSNSAIFEAHQELLEDPALLEIAQTGILKGQSAAFAWQQAFTAQANVLAAMDNALLAARASDVHDIGRRVLRLLTGAELDIVDIPSGSILIADDLSPSDIGNLDIQTTVGFCLTKGSAISHASLLARSAGIVAVVAVPEKVLDIANGTKAILNGDKGFLRIHPNEEELRQVQIQQEKAMQKRAADQAMATEPAVTKDGVRIIVAGNIGGAAEAETLILRGGEGVGLLRSEFLFLQKTTTSKSSTPTATSTTSTPTTQPPSENEQIAAYTAIAQTLGSDRDFIVRTLDVGGDKPLSYLPLPPEMNPFLGIRGIRLNLIDTNLFRVQVRAILRAAPLTRLHIMFPMVSCVEELRNAKAIVLEEKIALGITAPVSIGIMVEVPSAALLAENLAAEVDFFSIGTNDLTQYTLAMDRGHPQLAALADGLHPAVLRLIALTVEGAHKHGKWVGVCGGMASLPEAIPLLIGLGVDELSADVEAIPAVKSIIRRQNAARCKVLAADALTMLSASDIRQYMQLYDTEL